MLEDFARRVRAECPEVASSLCAIPKELREPLYHEVLGIPWPPDPARCRFAVFFRGDCFEMSFSVAGTRGPAEMQIVGEPFGDAGTMVEGAVEFLSDLFAGGIVVALERYRWLWFAPYTLAFFRRVTERPWGRGVVEVLAWRGAETVRRET